MKNADITIGGIYQAKVSDKLTDVRIDAENPSGGWDATNLATKKKVRIKSAQRLRAPASKESSPDKSARKPKAKATVEAKPAKETSMTALDAAAAVLKKAKEPMTTKEMVAAMSKAKLWRSTAATPWATLYSGILREIQKKGKQARFEKAERGKFQIRSAKKGS